MYKYIYTNENRVYTKYKGISEKAVRVFMFYFLTNFTFNGFAYTIFRPAHIHICRVKNN